MRFPRDKKETERIVLHAIEQGVNYFDTAFIYGNSEVTLGRILKQNNKRQDVKIATKIPPALLRKYEDFDKYLEKQLHRLQTDYIDYYFIHMITDIKVWQRLVGLGIEQWIEAQKAAGRIRNIGFSYHGGRYEFIKICDAYEWEFCMIQYNYLDEHNQAGKTGLRHAAAKGMPVMIMEPLRGGMLANNLPKNARAVFKHAYVNRSPAEWSFRWIYNQLEVTCVLSGMSSMEMLTENIAVASSTQVGDFTKADEEVINKAKKAFADAIKVPCTGCNYCMPCPQGVDIPTCLSCYNDIVTEGRIHAIAKYVMQTSLKTQPQVASRCNQCGICEKKCPQSIEIRKELKQVAKRFEKIYLKPILFLLTRFMRLK